MKKLKQAHGNWVAGERFWDREDELALFIERIEEEAHQPMVALRRSPRVADRGGWGRLGTDRAPPPRIAGPAHGFGRVFQRMRRLTMPLHDYAPLGYMPLVFRIEETPSKTVRSATQVAALQLGAARLNRREQRQQRAPVSPDSFVSSVSSCSIAVIFGCGYAAIWYLAIRRPDARSTLPAVCGKGYGRVPQSARAADP